MSIPAFLALASLLLAIFGLASSRWPLATPLAVIFLALAVVIIGFGGHVPMPGH